MEIESTFLVAHDPQDSIRRRQHAVAALASSQHGVVARRQLLSLGFSAQEIKGMLGNRRLLAIHRGVYAAGHLVLSQKGRWMAAALACGPGALLSHRSAAALRSLRPTAISYRVVRMTWRQIEREPRTVARTLSAALGLS